MRVSNNKARDYVNILEEFQGSNMFAKWVGKVIDNETTDHMLYVVYSYGSHFPMYVYDKTEDKWIGNKDKYSRSTTRHQSLARPSGEDIMWLDTDEIKNVVWQGGLVEYLINKAQH